MSQTPTLRTIDDLVGAGLVAPSEAPALAPVAEAYAIALPEALARLVDMADANDPVFRQYVPTVAELDVQPYERLDPIGDAHHSPLPGLVHRYPDRVLLKVTPVCPVYCRFCFRREQVGPENGRPLSRVFLTAAIDYIAGHPEIREVILTGGDPFMLSISRVRAITAVLGEIDHLEVIRWHTRMPVAAPDRVTEDYARAIATENKAVFVAIHANHARELTEGARAAMARLRLQGITLVSQSVLLRGINDSVEALAALMRAFLSAGVKPYYLHHLDPAPGTSHFHVPVAEGQALMRALRDAVSGLAVPHYVVDIPGGVSKANLALADVEAREAGLFVRGRDGSHHRLDAD